jgi:hypothetical protein
MLQKWQATSDACPTVLTVTALVMPVPNNKFKTSCAPDTEEVQHQTQGTYIDQMLLDPNVPTMLLGLINAMTQTTARPAGSNRGAVVTMKAISMLAYWHVAKDQPQLVHAAHVPCST